VITNLLNAIHYENVLLNESKDKSKIINKSLKILFKANIYSYSSKLQRAKSKILALKCLHNSLINLKSKNRKRAIRSPEIEKIKEFRMEMPTKLNLNTKIRPELPNTDSDLKIFVVSEIKNAKKIKKNKNEKFFPPFQAIMEIETETELTFEIKKEKKDKFNITNFSYTYLRRGKRNIFGRIRNYLTPISNYKYILKNIPGDKSIVDATSLQIIDKHNLNKEAIRRQFRSNVKSWSYLVLFVASWMFLFIMITDVYNKYESNMYDISISPLVSVLLVKFLVTQNIMIFIHTFIMYFFGEKYYNDNRKKLSPLHMIFHYVIPPIAKANHKAILAFLKFSKAFDDRNN